MNKKQVFRASYSTLRLWEQGRWQQAINAYFKLQPYTNKYIEYGIKKHKEWADEIEKTGNFPKIFGTKKLKDPKVEIKLEKQLSDWLELVGVIDLYDDEIIYDWKTGQTSSSTYANGFQPKVYQILFPKAKRAELHHYNQYNKKVDMSILHLTDKTLEDGINWVVTIGSEMFSYFNENQLYERFL